MTRRSQLPARLLPPFRRLAGRACALAAGAWLAIASPAVGQLQYSDKTPGLKNEKPPPVQGMELKPRLGERIPLELPLTDASGRQVRLGEFFGRPARDGTGRAMGHPKPVVLIMVYFRCSLLCPMVLEKFTGTLKEVDLTAGREFDAVVVSFDHRDSATDAAAQRNAQVMIYNRGTTDDAREGWTFLVGKPENTRVLGDALGFPYRYLPEAGEFSHGTSVFVLTPDGRISRQFTGLNYPASDVRQALVEASEGRIGSLLDKFTFWCFHYDPAAGTYSLRIMRIMQAGAAVATVALGATIGVLLWRERRRRTALAAHELDPSARVPGALPEAV